ncbi:hypothetical protein B0H13DRAFT_1639942, partial [Mycena leptocephala]
SERVEQNYSKKRVGEGDVRLDDERLSRALHEEKKRKAARGEEDDDRLGKKRKNAGGSHDVTEEELEAYRMSRRMTEDPMANYVTRSRFAQRNICIRSLVICISNVSEPSGKMKSKMFRSLRRGSCAWSAGLSGEGYDDHLPQ